MLAPSYAPRIGDPDFAKALVEDYGLDTGIGIMHHDACDNKVASQTVLTTARFDHGGSRLRRINHVNIEIAHLVSPEVQANLETELPDEKPEARKSGGKINPTDLERRLQAALDLLSDEGRACPPGHEARCLQCD